MIYIQALSTRYEPQREAWEETWRASETVPEEAAILAVSLDGVMAPMAKTEVEAGSQAPGDEAEGGQEGGGETSGKRHFREASCGTVSLYDVEGQRLSTVRYGRMPESKKAT